MGIMGVPGKEINYQEDKKLKQITPGNPRPETFPIEMTGMMIIIIFFCLSHFFPK